MNRTLATLMLVFALTTGALIASEQDAEAFHGGWHPSWGCMAGTTLIGLGIVHSASSEPPPGVDWRYLYGKGLEAAGAWLTLTQCLNELVKPAHANANACVKSPSREVRRDSVWLWPGWWWEVSSWRSVPCVVKTWALPYATPPTSSLP